MADFDVFGSQDGGDFQVSGSAEWFANTVQVGNVITFTSSASIKKTAWATVNSIATFTSSASLKKAASFSATSAFGFESNFNIQRRAKAVQIAVIYLSPIIKVVA